MRSSHFARLLLGAVLLLSFSGWAFAQSSDAQTSPGGSSKENKKDKKKSTQEFMNAEVFSDDVARKVLDDLRIGLEGHSYRMFESGFDADKMDGYLTFEDQVEAMFQQYSEFRVHFRISQSSSEGAKGIVLVDIQMEQIPSSSKGVSVVPQRRNGQVRFELERGKRGWKIVDFSPRGFFS